jgi:1,2-diacylglycerol 3-alpha-glucosyltransferase
MRIALLTPTFFQFSGIDRVVEMDVARLAKEHDVTVFCLAGDIEVPGVRLVRLGMPRSSLLSRVYRLLFFLDLLKRRRVARELATFDVIHTHFYPMSVLAADAKRRNAELRVIEHDYGVATPELFSSLHERIYLRVFKWFSYRYMRWADEVISISRYLADILKREAGIDARVEHIVIDARRFHAGIDGASVRKKYGLGTAPVCLYVGRLSPHKGIHDLIAAYRVAKRELPDLKLLIGGKPTFKEYHDRLLRLKGDDPDIHFIGFVPDDAMPAFYAAATVYTTATHWEGFDMPIPEAAACGTPTVAFDLCSHPEVTTDGILVAENDTVAFGEAIVKLVRREQDGREHGRVSSRQNRRQASVRKRGAARRASATGVQRTSAARSRPQSRLSRASSRKSSR